MGSLYERHSARVYALARRLAGDDEQAADWAQDAWVNVVRALPGFRGESRFTTWVHRITVNTVLHGARRNRRRARLGDEAGGFIDDLEQTAPTVSPLVRLTLEEAIDRLPERMRRVLILHDVEGYTHEEIGRLLGIASGTCKSQLFKARAKLREILEPSNVAGESICT
jgi:RNA polymerase sigma-70 factor (ECF subfamily)